MILHALLAIVLLIPSLLNAASLGYVVGPGGLSKEDSAAVAWMKDEAGITVRLIDIKEGRLDKPGVDVVWVHIPDSTAYTAWQPHLNALLPLAAFYRDGGKLLLTDYGALVPHLIGIESVQPEVKALAITNDWLFDQKGFQGFRGHPVFRGFFGGVFTWDTDRDNTVHRIGFFGSNYPKEGKVVGIEKSYVVLESDNKLAVEYASEKGRALAYGSFVYFNRPNAKRLHLQKFLLNSIDYLMSGRGKTTYWLPADNVPREFTVRTVGLTGGKRLESERLPASRLLLRRTPSENQFYDVAGRRALVMGHENGGVDELWIHPFRVLRDFQPGIVSGDSILWLKNMKPNVEIRPESFTRIYRTGQGLLKEIVFPSLERAGAIVHYEIENPSGHVALVVTYRCDLRWMWPYDERALGDVYYGYDDALDALHVRDRSGDFYCVIGADRRPAQRLSGPFAGIRWEKGALRGDSTDANQVYHGAVYQLGGSGDHALTLALAGTDEGKDSALADYRFMLARPATEYAKLVTHYENLFNHAVTVATPDSQFDTLWKWALVGTDRFVTTTPGLGTALVAGFSTVDRGWDGGHKISGRPGYAWYFGRDAVWSSFAIDGYGDFTTVRDELRFLEKYQDITGKIFHEVSTSGVVHYDASDATPLYILLAAHYLKASGDTAYLQESWPVIKKAMDFLYSTDTDGDMLIENTNVGHGWVEGGKLWPVHTEFYLAGIWGEALSDASWMASLLGKDDLAVKYEHDARIVKQKVDTEFWNPSKQCYNFSKLLDGSYNQEPTVLPAPIMYLGWLDEAKVRPVLTRYAGHGFTSDWGTRIVSDRSPLFNPQGYHYGSVWPLFTGWTALAEYEYGNSVQGFSHILNNMFIKKYWALGFVEEVMDGAVYKPSGVCPHQCWSETNILHPGIHGMIGWSPRAPEHAASLSPRFPVHWHHATIKNLRVGNSILEMSMKRDSRSTVYLLVLRQGTPVDIDLSPEIPLGMKLLAATVNGRPVPVSGDRKRGLIAEPLKLHIAGRTEIRFTHVGGVGVVPLKPHPAPGDSSVAPRIIAESYTGHEYLLTVEGTGGTEGRFALALFDQRLAGVDGAAVSTGREGQPVLLVPFEGSGFIQKQLTVRLQKRHH